MNIMNNLKFKALAILLGWFGAVLFGVGIVQILAHYFGPEGVVNIIVGLVLAWLIFQVYGLILAKLEYDAKLEELNKRD